MQYYRCVCGEMESWTSMGVPNCLSCLKCGSDLAQSTTLHRDPEPHEYATRYDTTTGAPYEVCLKCWERKPPQVE